MATSSGLFDFVPKGRLETPYASLPFAGSDYMSERDAARLTRQIDYILAATLDAGWMTIQRATSLLRKRHPHMRFPENSVQAQLRNLRKVGYRVERRHVAGGMFQYRVLSSVNPGVGTKARRAASDAA